MKTLKHIIDELLNDGYTQDKLANIAGVTQTTISKLKTGRFKDILYEPGKKLEIELNNKKRRRK